MDDIPISLKNREDEAVKVSTHFTDDISISLKNREDETVKVSAHQWMIFKYHQ